MDFDAVADELYALRPEEFTAARASAVAAARTAGDRELADRIGTLRKPSLAAWASNLLVRSRPGDVEPLLRLGEGLRHAHHALDRTQLRELSRQQHALIRALSAQARQLAVEAGHPIGEGVQREVENTLHAVLADPEAAQAWASGRLAKPLSAAVGFPLAESAGTESATTQPRPSAATAPSRPGRKAGEEQRRRLAQARRDAEAADRELRALKDEAAAAGQAAEEAKQQVSRLQGRVDELTEELARTREEHQQARFAERSARERARTADRRVREADRKAATAAAQLERLTSSDA
ncbi:hypothetical protein [Streptomyces coeruleorubidus]|uniref:Uncharacterized protein n=1 Tax=Streptomyces coeruleorubidus TaxID=116188 RepID=A0A5J6IEP6_STRC4|nr:hypothetical protein [Streptomyces coeruleorubidus]QEV29684.1 hypothetical protein CP976_40025 [Streptomyces coeruleorubidus]GGT98660.1 hypothetical protein GCM10010256_68290 [Streptomyces coeruleorubidus]